MGEFNNYIKSFKDEIDKYTKGVHNLNKGVSLELIEICEKKLKVKIPLMYKSFLMTWNGGELFAIPVGVELTEVYIETTGPKKRGIGYLDESLCDGGLAQGLPKEYLIIADTCDGDIVCLDLINNDGNEAKIIKWNQEEEEIVESWNTLSEWLMEEMEIGKLLINYDGSDKE